MSLSNRDDGHAASDADEPVIAFTCQEQRGEDGSRRRDMQHPMSPKGEETAEF